MAGPLGLTLVIAGGAGLLLVLGAYLRALRAAFMDKSGPDSRRSGGTTTASSSDSDELFAELYALRASVGEMASELRAVRVRLETLDHEDASKPSAKQDAPGLSRVA